MSDIWFVLMDGHSDDGMGGPREYAGRTTSPNEARAFLEDRHDTFVRHVLIFTDNRREQARTPEAFDRVVSRVASDIKL